MTNYQELNEKRKNMDRARAEFYSAVLGIQPGTVVRWFRYGMTHSAVVTKVNCYGEMEVQQGLTLFWLQAEDIIDIAQR